MLEEIGYHCRDYFLAQPERFASTRRRARALDAREGHGHLRRGDRHRDAARHGDARHRHFARSAAGRINLGYRDPASIDVAAWRGREREGMLVVPRAGEMLYRLKPR